MSRPPGSLTVLRSQRVFAIVACACLVLWHGVVGVASEQVTPASRPNIVLMFPDNLGWGEVNVYGGVRGAITPRLDRLAAEGLRLNNFNVEFSCTVSRAALMTGRYAIRTGATQAAGITLWEVTIAEALQSIGYATGLFGKWHLGGDRPENRNPSQQGFDEYYGIPRTSNEAQTTIAQARPRRIRRSSGRAGPDRRRATSSRSIWRRAAPSIASRPRRLSRSWSAASATRSPSSSITR
jgi:arylsulfatase A-like enzyme